MLPFMMVNDQPNHKGNSAVLAAGPRKICCQTITSPTTIVSQSDKGLLSLSDAIHWCR